MKFPRKLPPSAGMLSYEDLTRGLMGMLNRERNQKQLQAEMREYFGVKHVFFLSSGKAALTLILMALKSLSPRRRVVIPAYTCFSVPSSICKAELDVALCDIDPNTLDFDIGCLEETLDEKTLCVVPTHLLGLPSDIDRVKTLCRQKGIVVVEDAAQAMGVKLDSGFAGTLGDIGFFSLGRGKNVTCGSGGIIVTNSDTIALAVQEQYARIDMEKPLSAMKNLFSVLAMRVFIEPSLYWLPAMLPFLRLGETKFYNDFPMRRMDGVRLGLLARWREQLEQSNRARCSAARSFIERQGGYVVLPQPSKDTVFLRLPIMMESKEMKDKVCAESDQKGLGISRLYPTPVCCIKELDGKLNRTEYPASASVAERLVTLPVHHLVREEDQKKICEILECLSAQASPLSEPKYTDQGSRRLGSADRCESLRC